MRSIRVRLAILVALTAAAVAAAGAQTSSQNDEAFHFKSGVELVNVTATVSDDNGHFVSGLTKIVARTACTRRRRGTGHPRPSATSATHALAR